MIICWPLGAKSWGSGVSLWHSSVSSACNLGVLWMLIGISSCLQISWRIEGPHLHQKRLIFLWGRNMRCRLHIKGVYTYMVAPYMWPHEWNEIRYTMAFRVLVYIWLLPLESNFMAFTERVLQQEFVLEIYPPCPSAGLSLSQTCLKIEMEYYFSSQVISCSCQEFVTVCWSLLV